MGRACKSYLIVTLVIFNVMYMLVGAAILCLSIYCYLDNTIQTAISKSGHKDKVQNLIYGLIGLGSLVIVVAVFGCCGAYHQSACLLGAYFICLLIMFGVELTVGIVCLVFQQTIAKRIFNALDNVMNSFHEQNVVNGSSGSYQDMIQKLMHCCGSDSIDEYDGPNIPISCCIPGRMGCPSKAAAYQVGCRQVMKELVREKYLLALALTMSVSLGKVSGLLFALLLCCLVRKQPITVEYVEVHIDA